jgi:hypothetical protein
MDLSKPDTLCVYCERGDAPVSVEGLRSFVKSLVQFWLDDAEMLAYAILEKYRVERKSDY